MSRNTKSTLILTMVVAAFSAASTFADTLPENLSMYNVGLPADVNNDGQVNTHDLDLIFNVLRDPPATPLVAPLEASPNFYWDTSGNGRVNSQDALVVINYMLTNTVPEPSTVVTGGLGLAAMLGYCWRRRRTAT